MKIGITCYPTYGGSGAVATELGLEAYNILEGFEGDADAEGHRGRHGGWRFRGLPWRQS